MALLKRRSTPADTSAADNPDTAAAADTAPDQLEGAAVPAKTEGKGRPTPKRSEARAARARAGAAYATPANRKEARAQGREERRRKSQEYRAAMMSGDVSKLPERERAPERVLARDFVDSRFNVGPFFLLVAVVYFVGGAVPNLYVRQAAALLMLVGILVVVVDSIVLARQVTKRVAERYPNSQLRVRAYAAQRALLPRRWRLPRPRVARGELR
jgi:hypothetical protein